MWYSSKEELDYSKPIVAERKGVKYLLVPYLGGDNYEVTGYDWLDIGEGKYSSCRHFKFARDAVSSRINSGYKVYNVKITTTEI